MVTRVGLTKLKLSANSLPIRQLPIGHVRYINILTWLRGFRVKLLYLVLFSLYPILFWELRDKRNVKNLQFWPESLGAMLEYWYIERGLFDRLKLSANSNKISEVDFTAQNRLNVLINCSKTYSSCIESHNICTNTREFVKNMLLTSSVQK